MLIFVLFKPIWKIEFWAPQYPEGLMMLIDANGITGDLDIINGLNHYIGMKTIVSEDFFEFKILPYIIIAFALFAFIAGIVGKRKLMYSLLISFVLFGIIAIVDFWAWEYNYGHNLDPKAAIIVPGMAYQPPLIGYKKLLNFGVYSVPHIGAWLFIAVGAILISLTVIDYRVKKRNDVKNKTWVIPVTGLFLILISACSVKPEPIKVGVDNCHYCKMTISDKKFGGEIITRKGKIFKYDESQCLFEEMSNGTIDTATIRDIYFTDFCREHQLVENKKAFYLKSSGLKTPMGGDIAVFSSHDSLLFYKNKLGGEEVKWNQLISGK